MTELMIPPNMLRGREGRVLEALQTGSGEALAAARMVDRYRLVVATAKAQLTKAEQELQTWTANLERELHPGEGVMTTERLYFMEVAPIGAAGVNAAAVRAHADLLGPIGLAPREVVTEKLPTVAAVKKAARSGELRRVGLRLGDLLVTPPEGPALRYRTIGTGEVE